MPAPTKTTTRVQFQGCPSHEPFQGEQCLVGGALKWESGHLGSGLVLLPLEKQLPDLWGGPLPWQMKLRMPAEEEIFHHRCLCWLFLRAKREVMSSPWIGGR